MRKPGLLVLCVCSAIVVSAIAACQQDASPSSQTASAGAASTSTAGARIDKPFTLQVSGADCYSGTGDYSNVGIAGKAAGQKPFVGYGMITVNADEQSGTFRLPDGSASGTWDCGHKLAR